MPRTIRIVVCHPGRQYSHELATALAEAGMLAKYVTGVPAHEAAGGWLGRRAFRSAAQAYALPLDPCLIRHVFIAPIVRRVAARFMRPAAAVDWAHRAEAMFDRYVARGLATDAADAIVGYENASLEIFRQAKRMGATTILDAASFHHAWQDRFYAPAESAAAHRRIVARKDAELALADDVITVSELARQSYLEAGMAPQRVHAVPLGVALGRFACKPLEVDRSGAPCEFVFVGQIDSRKGFDVLLAAMDRLAHDSRVCLTAYGKGALASELSIRPNCRYGGWLPHDRLAPALAAADVLVLPSRHDSFGMVVPEAMACGLPAIVTENVGAKEMITPGENGSIIPADDATALAGAILGYVERREQLSQMARRARAAAERYDWGAYRGRVVAVLQACCQSKSEPESRISEFHGK